MKIEEVKKVLSTLPKSDSFKYILVGSFVLYLNGMVDDFDDVDISFLTDSVDVYPINFVRERFVDYGYENVLSDIYDETNIKYRVNKNVTLNFLDSTPIKFDVSIGTFIDGVYIAPVMLVFAYKAYYGRNKDINMMNTASNRIIEYAKLKGECNKKEYGSLNVEKRECFLEKFEPYASILEPKVKKRNENRNKK